MYFFRPSKKYDPTPYSYFRHWWHKLIGCPVENMQMELRRNYSQTKNQYHFTLWQHCKCGRGYATDLAYPRH